VVLAQAALAQPPSPCAGGSGPLISGWRVEGLPGTRGDLARSSLDCQSDGTIRQVVEVSKDGGRTWKVLFESIYSREERSSRPLPAASATTPPPAAPAAAESRAAERETSAAASPARETPPSATPQQPAVQPQTTEQPPPQQPADRRQDAQHQAARQASKEGSQVQALSRELEREEIPESEAPELIMASPMILEITPAELDEYPQGTAWSTDETAGFMCDQVVIRRITVGRRVRDGRTQLEVVTQLFTKRRQRSVDVLLEVMLDGQVVASQQLSKIRLGLNIPNHDKDGMPVAAQIELPDGTFERLFADGADRRLRVTLTVPAA
jgi:hypothetical protein